MAKQRETAFADSGEDLYAQIESARADMSARTQPPAEFTLTTDQLAKVKALLPAVGVNWTSAPFLPMPVIFGVPVRIVETVEESTPYQVQRRKLAQP